MKPTRRTFAFDAVAGLTVAVVALPLALAFGETTGVGAAAGLTTAIVAGIVAGLFGGSNYQVSGPTGAMTVVLVPIVAQYGPAALVPIGVLAGALLVLAALGKLGRFIERIPWSVMEGFTLGIAVVIAAQQIPFALATASPSHAGTITTAAATIAAAAWSFETWLALGIVIVTLTVKFGWLALQRRLALRFQIPGSIVAIVIVTALVWMSGLPAQKVGSIPVASLFEFQTDLSGIFSPQLAWAAVSVAVLGGIESLLSARVADAMAARQYGHETPKHQPNRELFGQGLATVASSLLGGMPATGAIARTSVNVNAGARTRYAAVMHGLFLLLFVGLLSGLVAEIPLAALAGVLLATSWRIANPESVRENLQTVWPERVSYLVTAVAVIGIDLIWGIVIGIVTQWLLRRVARSRAA